MTEDDEFTRRLRGFGLSAKEARLYIQLLKFGPKTPSPLAKSLKTYREDIYRTLTGLIEKGMVRPSLDSPTVYTPVDLSAALEATLKRRESELREMEARKRELHELAKQHRFSPSDGVPTYKIIRNLKELIRTMLPVISRLENEWDMLVPEKAVVVASQFGINPFTQAFIAEGGKVRILVTDFSYAVIPMVQELIDMGADVRHFGHKSLKFTVFDKKISMSGINWEILRRMSLDEPITALWTDDPAYGQYLTSTFEIAWKQSVPVEERIQQLLEQGPPKATD